MPARSIPRATMGSVRRHVPPIVAIMLVAACSASTLPSSLAGTACSNAGGTCFVGGAVCAHAPDSAQDCNPNRNPGGGICCLGSATQDAAPQDASASDANGNADAADASSDSPCVPRSCSDLGYDCGYNGDGCGNIITCGACTAPDYCGGGGLGRCGTGSGSSDAGPDGCQPLTCMQLGYDCGPSPDGCGGVVDCGTCTPPEFCGGGGFSKCGPTD